MINQSECQDNSKKFPTLDESSSAISKLTFSQEGQKQSSLSTVFGITNSMVGSLFLVILQAFQQCRVITCSIVMTILCQVQYKTCQIMIIHQKEEEFDSEYMIKSSDILSIIKFNYPRPKVLELYLKHYYQQLEQFIFNQQVQHPTQFQFRYLKKAITLAVLCLQIVLLQINFQYNGNQQVIANMLEINEFKGVITWLTWNFIQPAGQYAFDFMALSIHNMQQFLQQVFL